MGYTIRFTPRRRGSIWSAINIRRVPELTGQGLMQPAELPEAYAKTFRRDKAAWAFFHIPGAGPCQVPG